VFRQIIHWVFSPFKRLKILHQILIIIGILIVFSSVQGILGFNIINTLSNNSANIFDKTTHLITTFKDLQNDFMELQSAYNNSVVQSNDSVQAIFRTAYLPGITSKIDYIKNINPKTIAFMNNKLLVLKKTMAQPVNAINSKALDNIIFDIKNSLKSQSDNVLVSSYQMISDDKNFSKFATFLTLILLFAGSILSILAGIYITHLIVHPLYSIYTPSKQQLMH
jgi:predicted PurR-regulated permease PerM